MKPIKIILFFLLCFFQSFSQNYLPADSSVWHYQYSDHPPAGEISVNYIIIGDTNINSNQYTLLSTDFASLFIMRQDSSGKIYTRYLNPLLWSCVDTNELLTYDFKLQVSDTFIVHTCLGDSAICIVDNIDSIMTNVGNKKRFVFSISNSWVSCYNGSQMQWVEGIGNLSDLFYNLTFPNQICLSNYIFLSLDSYGNNIYNLSTSINENNSNNSKIRIDEKFQIYPNPFEDKITIHSIYPIDGKFNVIDELGKIVFEENISGNKSFDFSFLEEGVYFFSVEVGKRVFREKFVKINR